MTKRKMAVLDSSLLVRKGEARPSVFSPSERAPVGQAREDKKAEVDTEAPPEPPDDPIATRQTATSVALERIRRAMLGGATIPFPGMFGGANDPIDFAAVQRAVANYPRSRVGAGGLARRGQRPKEKRIALTLRLDPERHLRLKLFSVYARRSIQNVLMSSLDDYLDRFTPDENPDSPISVYSRPR